MCRLSESLRNRWNLRSFGIGIGRRLPSLGSACPTSPRALLQQQSMMKRARESKRPQQQKTLNPSEYLRALWEHWERWGSDTHIFHNFHCANPKSVVVINVTRTPVCCPLLAGGRWRGLSHQLGFPVCLPTTLHTHKHFDTESAVLHRGTSWLFFFCFLFYWLCVLGHTHSRCG